MVEIEQIGGSNAAILNYRAIQTQSSERLATGLARLARLSQDLEETHKK